MNKLFALLLGATLFSGATFAATAAGSEGASGTYYWLHPKLGMVKVDRTTNAIAKSRRPATDPAQQSGQPAAATR